MPKIQFSVAHSHDKATVVEKLKNFSTEMRSNLPDGVSDVEESWSDEGNLQFKISGMGMEISGTLVPSDNEVQLDGNLPFAALPFRGMIESQLKTGIEQALS